MYSAPVWRISTERQNHNASLLDTGRTPYKRQTGYYVLFPVISLGLLRSEGTRPEPNRAPTKRRGPAAGSERGGARARA